MWLIISGFMLVDVPIAFHDFFQGIASGWIAPFYMAAFFVITGYCSQFKKPYIQQIITDFRTLIVPAWIMCIVVWSLTFNEQNGLKTLLFRLFVKGSGGYWFVTAMFMARAIYYWIARISCQWLRIVLLLLVCFAGTYLNGSYNDKYWMIYHAMSFCVFLEVGRFVRERNCLKWKVAVGCALVYIVAVILMRCVGFQPPALCATQTFTYIFMPLFFMMASIGSLACIYGCKRMKQCKAIEYIGKNSVIYYITHFSFFSLVIPHISSFILAKQTSVGWSIAIFLMVFAGAVAFSSLLSVLINTKGMRWIIGKPIQ